MDKQFLGYLMVYLANHTNNSVYQSKFKTDILPAKGLG